MATTPWHRRFVGQVVVNIVPVAFVGAIVGLLLIVSWEVRQTLFPAEAQQLEHKRRVEQYIEKANCNDPATRCQHQNRGDELEKFFPAEPQPAPGSARRSQ